MIVNRYSVLMVLSFFYLVACENGKEKLLESYNIYNLILNDFEYRAIIKPNFAPPPSGHYEYTKSDSLSKYLYFYQQYAKKNIIHLDETTLQIQKENLHILKDCETFIDLKDFVISGKQNNIDAKYLNSLRKSEIVNQINSEIKADAVLSFSDVVFNKNKDKAILLLAVNFSELNGFTSIIYLEKNHYLWNIICEKTISIS